eukprot:CAMPEP_0182439720 /NCGR_PEP_ID=MMETSP1167-20130531/86605_1 /TAXON_ID=2988 /ORGANISM="Mallomonas Sp, Strain CCMP3275" /LENGTH=796 /DNA_ID=CAMNT_0024633477 /DNA_START=52 /DNA_END=2440 /DNA_ORIENTATION=+
MSDNESSSFGSGSSTDEVGIYLILIAGVVGAFGIILKVIIDIARRKMRKPKPLLKHDKFFREHQYSWDYVFVFRVWDEYNRDELNKTQSTSTMKFIIDRLMKGGLDTRCFYSAQRDEVYVKIRCSPARLKSEAARTKYPLQFDRERLRIKLQSGRKVEGKTIWAPVIIIDDFKVSEYDFNDYIFGKYDINPEVQSLYRTYRGGHIFRGVDRIKLILSIMEAKANEDGCGLNLVELNREQCLLAAFAIHDYQDLDLLEKRTMFIAAFAIHDYQDLDLLEKKWLKMDFWRQPLTEIKDYFGEKVGMYFLYLDHYFRSMLLPSILGFTVFILDGFLGSNAYSYFALLMIIWGFTYTELWKRAQVKHAMTWGVYGFENIEQNRPQFIGETISSPIHGGPELYFPVKKQRQRISFSNVTIFFAICVVLGFVSLIFLFTIFLQSAEIKKTLTISGLDIGSILASLVNALVIQVLNFGYQYVAIYLNDYENHRTDTKYEDYLIAKVFCFQMINCYASIFFTAYIKPFIGLAKIAGVLVPVCKNMDCKGEAGTILGTVFIARLVLLLFLEICIPMVRHSYVVKNETEGLEPGVKVTPIEKQYTLAEFDILKDTLKDYSELIIHYGYIILFVAAFPLVPAIAFVAGYILIRINGWKYCQIYRRPDPKSAEEIGTWQMFLELVTTLSIPTNLAIIIFTTRQFINIRYYEKWIAFIAVEHFFLMVNYIISAVIPDVPFSVKMQLERQEFIVSKVLLNIPDDMDDVEDRESSNVNLIINDTDRDWEKLGDEEKIDNMPDEVENILDDV